MSQRKLRHFRRAINMQFQPQIEQATKIAKTKAEMAEARASEARMANDARWLLNYAMR